MIGLGSRGYEEDAQDFAARHDITFRMCWDRRGDSWQGFGTRGTPTSILVSRRGTQLKRWIGMMQEDERAEALQLAHDQG